MGNFLSGFNWRRPLAIFRYRGGQTYYEMYNSKTSYQKSISYDEKLRLVFSNPAVLKVFKLNCDLFSMGILKAESQKGKDKPNDPLLKLLQNPNPFQNRRQFMWDAMFWYMLGNGYLYSTRKVVSDITYLYWLNPEGLSFDKEIEYELSQMVISPKKFKEIQDRKVLYRESNGSTRYLRFGDIISFHDLSNGIGGNWMKSNSALDALYKIVSNSEAALDAKNINIRFSGKYMVAGKKDINDIHGLPMSLDEQENIEANINNPKSITATKSMVDIKRYVENIDKLKLDDAYKESFMRIGSMYNIPKEILDAVAEGSTYENQEKATGRHVEYVFKPKATDLISGIENRFGYSNGSTRIRYTFDHLLFMRIFEREAETGKSTKLNNLMMGMEQGFLTEEEYMDRGRKIFDLDE